MTCIEFFSDSEKKEKCKFLQDMPQDTLFAWELENASKYSPCIVDSQEWLYRQLINPIHYDEETNTLAVTAFDDASSIGLSVNRANYITENDIVQMTNDRVKKYNESYPDKQQRSFAGIVQFLCKDIREITTQIADNSSPIRGFCVYDTALEHDKSHADICQIVKSKQHGRSVRSKIRDIANSYLKNLNSK